MQFKEKIVDQTWEKSRKPNLGSNFGPFESNLGHQIFFLKNLALSVTRYHGQLSLCTISNKTNDPILRKLSQWLADRQTDKSDFIGRCATKVKHPIWKVKKLIKMKELNEIALGKRFFASVKGQICLTKGHLGYQKGIWR